MQEWLLQSNSCPSHVRKSFQILHILFPPCYYAKWHGRMKSRSRGKIRRNTQYHNLHDRAKIKPFFFRAFYFRAPMPLLDRTGRCLWTDDEVATWGLHKQASNRVLPKHVEVHGFVWNQLQRKTIEVVIFYDDERVYFWMQKESWHLMTPVWAIAWVVQ